MNRNLLIDAVVRQATVLVAHLATQGGSRAPLSDVADQVFRSLVAELDAQAVGQKVIADMFGMALRTYYARVRRLAESKTMRGRSLWEAVLSWIRERGPVARDEVMRRFQADDEQVLRAVLRDLTEQGLITTTGRGSATKVGATIGERVEDKDALVWVAVFHAGQTTAAAVADALRVSIADVDAALARLELEGRVVRIAGGMVRADQCVIPDGDEAGWEGAVYDHLQAVVGALCHKVTRIGREKDDIDLSVGGSTYTFDMAPDNPAWGKVAALLARYRAELSALRSEAEAFEAERPAIAKGKTRFVFYLGENVLAERLPTNLPPKARKK